MPSAFFTDTAVLWQNNPVGLLSCVLDFVISFHCAEKSDGNSADMMPYNSCFTEWKEVVLILAYRGFSERIPAQHCVFFEIFVYLKMDRPPPDLTGLFYGLGRVKNLCTRAAWGC